MPRERVLFHSDRLRLVGDLYLPAGEGPWPGLVICHGMGSRKERHADFASYASGRGLAVLAFDLRGHGESEGKLDCYALNDIAAALDYLSKRPEVDATRIAVRGSSLGGHFALHAAAAFSQIRACVAICPAPENLLQEGLRQTIDRGVTISDVRLDLASLPRYLRESDLRRSVARIAPRPLLMIQCQGDQVVPATGTNRLFDLAGEPKALWLLPGGNHATAQHDPEIHERTVDWVLEQVTP